MNETVNQSMLRARGLRKEYGRDASLVRAVDDVTSTYRRARRWQ